MEQVAHTFGVQISDKLKVLGTLDVVGGIATGDFEMPHMNRVDPVNTASILCVWTTANDPAIMAPIRITSI